MIRLLVATYNQGKLAEFASLLGVLPVHIVGPNELGLYVAVEERGTTYAANARLKADAFLRVSGLPSLGDDSGLEVDALNGEPGLHSARYAGSGASDQDRCRLLLKKLAGVPWDRRTARFRCALALATPDAPPRTVEGVCEGFIALEPCGQGGFGYDPVFFLPDRQCTMAQLPPQVKNQVSHRASAVRAMLPILGSYTSASSCTSADSAQKEAVN